MGHPVVQWQIVTPMPESVAQFYGSLFGWDVRANNQLGYRMIDPGNEKGIPGGIWPAPPTAPTFVQLIIEVDDLAVVVERTVALGGTVLIPPQQLPDGDEMAVLRDPQGLSFGVTAGPR